MCAHQSTREQHPNENKHLDLVVERKDPAQRAVADGLEVSVRKPDDPQRELALDFPLAFTPRSSRTFSSRVSSWFENFVALLLDDDIRVRERSASLA